MSHLVVDLKPDANYMGTTVPFARSLMQIEDMLKKHGCDRIAKQEDNRGDFPLVTLLFEHGGIPYIFEFPVIYEHPKNKPKRLRMDVSARVVHDWVKSTLVVAEIYGFGRVMSPFLAVSDGNGHFTPLYDRVVEHAGELASGRFDLLKLPGA